MTKPSWYYSHQTGEVEAYGSRPPGKMSIQRMIQSLPAFLKRMPGQTLKPKTLVVVARTESLDPVAVKKKLVELMQLGHDVYLQYVRSGSYVNNEKILYFDKLTEDWIEYGSIRWQNMNSGADASAASGTEPADLRQNAYLWERARAGDVLMIDHYDLQCLLEDDFNPHTRVLYERDLFKPKELRHVFDAYFSRPSDPLPPPGLNPTETRFRDLEMSGISTGLRSPAPCRKTRLMCEEFNMGRRWRVKETGHEYDVCAGFTSAAFMDEHMDALLKKQILPMSPMNFLPEYLAGLERLSYVLPSHRLPIIDRKMKNKKYGTAEFITKKGYAPRFKFTSDALAEDEKHRAGNGFKAWFAKDHGTPSYMAAREKYLAALEAFYHDREEHERQFKANSDSVIDYGSIESRRRLEKSPVDRLLSECPNLRELSLAYVKQQADWPVMPQLKKLSLGYYPHPEALLDLLSKCPALETLFIESRTFSSETVFPRLDSLKELHIGTDAERTQHITPCEILPHLLAAAPNLEKLTLDPFTTRQITNWPDRLPNLRELKLDGLHDLDEIMQRCSNLEQITISECVDANLPPDQVHLMFSHCPRLRQVNVVDIDLATVSIPFLKGVLQFVPALSPCCRYDIETALFSAEKFQMVNKQMQARAEQSQAAEKWRSEQRNPSASYSSAVFDDLSDLFTSKAGSSQNRGTGRLPEFNPDTDSSSSSESLANRGSVRTPINSNQTCDPQRYRSRKPRTPDTATPYHGGHKHLNQNMVIDQLSQYLTCQNRPVPDYLEEGICNALSHLCAIHPPQEWRSLLGNIRDWDGRIETLTSRQHQQFEQIRRYVGIYQFDTFSAIAQRLIKGHMKKTWLGEHVLNWLPTQTKPCVLSNAWHAICLKPLRARRGQQEPAYFAYDPNFIEGGVRLRHSDLEKFLRQSLGDINLICVEGNHTLPPLPINGPAFLASGGLLILCFSSNSSSMLRQLQEQEQPYDIKALQGLLLRNLEGMPAWFCALESNRSGLQRYALRRLAEFMAANPLSWWTQLEQSLEEVRPGARDDIIQRLQSLAEKHRARLPAQHLIYFDGLPDLQRAVSSMNADRAALQPIQVKPVLPPTQEAFLDELCTSDKPSHLIHMRDVHTLQGLRFALQAQAKKLGRPLIYIDSPEALILSNPYVALQPDGQRGLFTKGPGGPVYEQLITGTQPPLIVVNFDNFPREHVVRFNQLIDKNPNADGIPLPPGTTVLALQNLANPNRYQGSDLSSRFAVRERWPDNLTLPSKPALPRHTDSDDAYPLHLFQAVDWKERLLGYWAPRGHHLEWIEGELPKALQSGKPISLVNAPDDQKGFEEFWLEACANGFIEHEQQRIDLPENFSLGFRNGYDWAEYARVIGSWGEGIDAAAETLNTYTMNEFLTRYLCLENSHSVVAVDGLLKDKYAGHNLVLNISHAMKTDHLAHFIHECAALGVTLHLNLANGVTLPNELTALLPPPRAPLPPLEPAQSTQLIASSDPGTTRSQAGREGVISLNVSECEPADLLDSIDGFLDEEQCRLNFHTTRGLLPDLLEREGHTLILTGSFSPELNQALTPFLLKRHVQDGGKRLMVIPDHSEFGDDLSRFLPCHRHEVSAEEKAEQLELPADSTYLNSEPLSRLRARGRYLKKDGADTNSNNAWRGLSSLPVSLPMDDFQPEHSKTISRRFTDGRRRAVEAVLAHAPFVVITGLTGVGKSTFVEKELGRDSHVHYGHEAARAWAMDKRPGRKILFPDESNLQGKSWTDYEGLMEDPPFIRIKNEILYVSKEHVVVYACNPASYGDRRNTPALFEQHGNAVVFDPMPQEFIYETILKPLLRIQFKKTQASLIAHEFLQVYRFLCERSEFSVLISPRELITMANLTIAHQNQQDDPQHVARHYARAIARDLVPEKHRNDFEQAFPPVELQPSDSVMRRTRRQPAAPFSSSSVSESSATPDREPFLYTESRLPVASLIEDMLNLRERCYNERKAPDDFLYGGLGGMIIESEPGQGKSEMIKDMLLARGYGAHVPGRQVYDIKASLNDEVKVEMWLQALDTGGVVLADEINSAPLPEAVVNAIAMRKTLDNKRPANPGLLIFGTQNAASMGGRQKASNAQSRRFINVHLPNYTDSEMQSILENEGLTDIRARLLIQIYHQERHRGIPVTFRDLLGRAHEILQAENPDYRITAEIEFPAPHMPCASPFDDMLQIQQGRQKQPVPERFEQLYAAIDDLRVKGARMKRRQDALSRQEGDKAVACADHLEARANELLADSTHPFREAFQTELRTAFEDMSTHRNTWYPALYQVGRAFRTLGASLVQGLSQGFLRPPNTNRQDLIRRIGDRLDELPEDPAP